MMSYYLHLICNGLTTANLEGRYIGTTDEPLCPEGIKNLEQAKEGLAQTSYFKNCEIKEIKEMPYAEMQVGAYRVTYVNETGDEKTVCLEEFPVSIFERYRIMTSDKPTSTIFWHGNQIQKLAGVYIACGVVMLGIEFFLYSVFYRLFRE